MRTAFVLVMIGLLAGCSDDNGVTPDQGPLPDQSVVDLMGGDGAVVDGPAVEGAVADGPVADSPGPDGSQGDIKGTDGPAACKQDSDCDLANNCCECNAYPAGQIPMCPLPCVNKTCVDSYQMTKPGAICVQGRCLVSDSITCSSDADCKLVKGDDA